MSRLRNDRAAAVLVDLERLQALRLTMAVNAWQDFDRPIGHMEPVYGGTVLHCSTCTAGETLSLFLEGGVLWSRISLDRFIHTTFDKHKLQHVSMLVMSDPSSTRSSMTTARGGVPVARCLRNREPLRAKITQGYECAPATELFRQESGSVYFLSLVFFGSLCYLFNKNTTTGK